MRAWLGSLLLSCSPPLPPRRPQARKGIAGGEQRREGWHVTHGKEKRKSEGNNCSGAPPPPSGLSEREFGLERPLPRPSFCRVPRRPHSLRRRDSASPTQRDGGADDVADDDCGVGFGGRENDIGGIRRRRAAAAGTLPCHRTFGAPADASPPNEANAPRTEPCSRRCALARRRTHRIRSPKPEALSRSLEPFKTSAFAREATNRRSSYHRTNIHSLPFSLLSQCNTPPPPPPAGLLPPSLLLQSPNPPVSPRPIPPVACAVRSGR